MLDPYPGAAQDAQCAGVILKGDLDAVHGHIGKQHVPDQGRKDQQVQLIVLGDAAENAFLPGPRRWGVPHCKGIFQSAPSFPMDLWKLWYRLVLS